MSPLHRNVQLSLAFTFALYAARGLWQSTILPLYIAQLAGGAKGPIGYLQSAQGLATLLVAAPAGWAADGLGRARVLRAAGACGLLAAATTIFAVCTRSLRALACALALWGAFSGAHTPALGALIADSANGGSMARLYVLRQISLQLATAIGPAVAIAVFLGRAWSGAPGGEEAWDGGTCAAIVVAGAGLQAVPCAMLFGLADVRTAEEAAPAAVAPEGALAAAEAAAAEPAARASDARDDARDDEPPLAPDEAPMPPTAQHSSSSECAASRSWLGSRRESAAVAPPPPLPLADVAAEPPPPPSSTAAAAAAARSEPGASVELIARLIVSADVVSGLSSGLSVRFFPLFFVEALGLGPIALNGVYVATPFLTALANWAFGRLSHAVGHAQTALAARLCSLSCLCAIIALSEGGGGRLPPAPAWLPLPLRARRAWIVALYCARCCALYSARPLTRAVLMGVVRKEERGRWQAFESVTSFGWSGSAALGGVLIDRRGYRAALVATGALQLLSVALLAPLPFVVPAAANGGARWRRAKWARQAAEPLLPGASSG